MSSYHDVQQVCLNGHQITANYNSSPEFRKSFCAECGERTIHQCPNCNRPIKGEYHVDGVFAIITTEVPTHCEHCGQPFPWHRKKAAIRETVKSQSPLDKLGLVEVICNRFHLVARQLHARHSDRETLHIADEYDVQDLLHALLRIHFDDIRPEEWTPSYAGSCSRVDFLLKQEQIVVEVKKTRNNLKARDIGEQLIVDIQKYRRHPDCKILVCFVYDPEGLVSNPKGLEHDLNSEDSDFLVRVLIVPRGH
jgi:DNA-directed RNA polymerase subunit N (RpoN/RPB10)